MRLLPIGLAARLFGVPLSTGAQASSCGPPVTVSPAEGRRLRALDAVLAHWPFADGPCLRWSLVAGRILRRCRPRLRLGAAMEGSTVLAHAWIEVDGVALGASPRFTALTPGGR